MLHTILTIQIISIVVLLFESIYVFTHARTRGQLFLFLYCFTAFINNLAYYFEMIAMKPEVALYGVKICYVGKSWLPLAFLAMLNELCDIKFPKKIYYVLIAIHTTVLTLVLTSDRHYLYYTEKREFVYTDLYPHWSMGHSLIYNIYMVIMFAYIIYGVCILIRKYRSDKTRQSRQLYSLLIAAVIIMGAGFGLYIAKVTYGYDSTSLGYAITSMLMFVAIFKFRLMDTLILVKDYVVDTIPDGIVATDSIGKVVYQNDILRKIYPNIMTDSEGIISSIKHSIEYEEVIKCEDSIYEPSVKPLYRQNQFSGELFTLTDVTVRYKHMEELREQKEIAEAANESKSAFLSVVTHEIRTPMTSVVGMTELLLQENDNLSEKQEKYLRNIKNSGDSLVMIVNDILDQSKIEAGKMEIIEDDYELMPLVEDVKMIIENRIGSKPIRLLSEIDGAIPQRLCGDSLRIRQILINLMNNAVKFTDSGYIKLSITCVDEKPEGRLLKFTIEDSGQGIKEEDLKKLGQVFTQVDTKRNHQKEGTGLGLSISKDFIKMMGGCLQVDSEYGKGSSFYFSLWQKNATNNDDSDAAEELVFTAENAKILVVDDTELNHMIIREFLKRLGITIESAKSGEQALELIRNKKYDIIFMDYMMPYMDGIEVTSKIRQMDGDNQNTPIIALSGDDSEDAKKGFIDAGISDFTAKPIEMDKLKSVIYKWLPKELIIQE